MMSGKHHHTWLISLDNDDTVMNNPGMVNWLKSIDSSVIVVVGNSISKVDAINRDMDKAGHWDAVIVVSDDMVPLVFGYDDILVTELVKQYHDMRGAVWFHDGHNDGTMTMTVMGRECYRWLGYLYWPEYKSFYCDNDLTETLKMNGRIGPMINQCVVEHQHYACGKAERDPLYDRCWNDEEHDRLLFSKRKEAGFPR